MGRRKLKSVCKPRLRVGALVTVLSVPYPVPCCGVIVQTKSTETGKLYVVVLDLLTVSNDDAVHTVTKSSLRFIRRLSQAEKLTHPHPAVRQLAL